MNNTNLPDSNFAKVIIFVVSLSFSSLSYAEGATEMLKNIAKMAISTLNANPHANIILPQEKSFDVENNSWDGGSITLDLNRLDSSGRQKNQPSTIKWTLKSPAFGSSLTVGEHLGTGSSINFSPDQAGIWKVLAHQQGSGYKKEIAIRLLSIPQTHPRIFLDPERIAQLRSKAKAGPDSWVKLKKRADLKDGEMLARALVGVITNNPKYCKLALKDAVEKLRDVDKVKSMKSSEVGDLAVVYDWCHGALSKSQEKRFIDVFNRWGDKYLKKATGKYGDKPDTPGLGNYWPRFTYSFGMIGLATYGENKRAGEWLDYFRHDRWPVEQGFLDFIAEGGGWPEGIVYDGITNFSRMRVLDAWKIATGENLFKSSLWFQERFGTLLLQHWPGINEEWGHYFHPYASNGDYERGRGTMDSYWRIAALILVNEFPGLDKSQQLRGYLSAPETAQSSDFIQYAEFLWFDPDGPSKIPTVKSHFDQSMGSVFLRSGWPDGASDLDTNMTHINFRCGDFYTYHQHFDQNSFVLFKNSDLALDSGIYSGNGTSVHDSNYFIRTIAHNTLVVYNENENLKSTRYNAKANDGGQRPMKPANRAPQSLGAYERDKKYYETGNILAYQDGEDFSYILGDATAAYNSVLYNQAMDTELKSNIAKLKQFQREFLYLRPLPGESDDYIVIYDRVGVTKPSFSGENTKLLFHVQNEPLINSTGRKISAGETLYSRPDKVTTVNGDGKLVVYPLLPKNLNTRVVGGRGEKAYWVSGENYNWHWNADKDKENSIASNFEKEPYGLWRIEIEPGDNELKHNFLTVLVPTSKDNAAEHSINTISSNSLEGVHIGDPKMNRIALFHKKLSQKNAVDSLSYSFTPGSDQTAHLIFGLNPGDHYQIGSTGSGLINMTVTPNHRGEHVVNKEGILSFKM